MNQEREVKRMKKAKRWLALILAVALLGSNGIYQLSTQLSAGETESQDVSGEDVSVQNEEENQVEAEQPAQSEESPAVTVQEVPQTQDTQQAEVAETPAEDAQAAAATQTVDVKIQKPAADGGQIKIWGDDGNRADVAFGTDGLYTKTINEGENIHFQITVKDGYTVEKVTDQNGTQIQPESVSGSEYTYSVNVITSERVLSILYKEATPAAGTTETTEDVAKDDTKDQLQEDVAQADDQKEAESENGAEKTETTEAATEDKTSEEATADQEITAPNPLLQFADQTMSPISLFAMDGRASNSYEIKVGESVTLTASRVYGASREEWSIADSSIASLTTYSYDKSRVLVNGLKPGTTTVTYTYYFGRWQETETYTITVKANSTPPATGKTRVYVYVKMEAGFDTSSWEKNDDGWYTIGYVDVDTSVLPLASEKEWNQYYSEYINSVVGALGSIVYYEPNKTLAQGINLSGLNYTASGYGLKIAAGASSYGDEADGGSKQWHLDGYISVPSKDTHTVTIRYQYEDGTVAAPPYTETAETGTVVTKDSPVIPDYTPDQATVNVRVVNSDVTVTVTYRSNYPSEKIVITADSDSRPYNGNALTKNSYTYTQGILLDGDVLTATVSGSQTNVGSSENVITSYRIMRGTTDVTGKYNIGTAPGTLEVTPAKVTVTAKDYTKTYGETCPDSFEATVEGLVDANDTIDYTVTCTDHSENAGTYEDVIVPSGATLQGNYEVTYVPADLTITKAERPDDMDFEVTGYENVYDGQGHTVTVTGLAVGDSVKYSADGENWTDDINDVTFTDVSENTVYVKVSNPNYKSVQKEAVVKITPFEITVTAKNASKNYGEDDPTPEAIVGPENKPNDGYEIKYDVTYKDHSEKAGTYEGVIVTSGDETQNKGNYTVTYVPGTLVINKSDRPASKDFNVVDYNGTYDANKHTVSVTDLQEDDTVEYSTDGENWTKEAPKYKNVAETPAQVWVKVSNPNYKDVVKTGTVTITPAPVVVKADNVSKVYGESCSDLNFTATVTGTFDGDQIDYTVSCDNTHSENVGDYPGVIKATGNATQGNYSVSYEDGDLKITKAVRDENAITVGNYSDVYNAAYHTITVSGTVDGDTVEYSTDGENWSPEKPSGKDVSNTTVQVRVTNPNYENVINKTGVIEITPFELTVTADNASKTYGQEDPDFTATVTPANEGTTKPDDQEISYNIVRNPKHEDAGTYEETLIPSGDELQGNYKVTYVNGDFEIKKAVRPDDKAISAVDYSGVYDNEKHTITVNGLADGDKVEYSYDGGENWTTDLKEYKHVTKNVKNIEVRVTNPNYKGEATASATVEITPFEMVVTANPASKDFGADDPEWTATVAPKNAGTTKPNDGVEIAYDIDCEHEEAAGTYENAIIPTGDEVQGEHEDYKVTFVPATFVINKINHPGEITVTDYDGTYDAKNHGITVNGTVDGDKVEYRVAGSDEWTTTPPEEKDVIDGKVVEVRVTNPNYSDTLTGSGTITIRPFEITVTADDKSKTFGEKDPKLTATESVTKAGTTRPDDQEITYKVSRGTQEAAGTYVDSILVKGDEIQGNYKVTYVPGTFTINQAVRDEKDITVKNYRDVYDAAFHSITVSGTVADDKVEYSYDNGKTWIETLTQYTNVMTETTIKVRVTNPNYSNAIEKEGTVEITPFEMTVAANPASKNFGEADPAWTASVAPTNAGTTKPNDGVEIAYGFNCEHDEAAGTYTDVIIPIGEETQGNYKVTYVPATFVINQSSRPAELDITVDSYEDDYDANTHTITVNGLTDGDEVEYSYDGGKNWKSKLENYTDVTETAVQILVKVSNPNYTGEVVKPGTVMIHPFEITVTADDKSKTFGEKDPKLTATETVTKAGTTRPDDQEITYKVSRGTQEAAGTYVDSILVKGDEIQGNYKVTYVPGTFTINQAVRDEKDITVKNYRDVYDAAFHSITVSGTVADDKVEYSYDNGKTWIETLTQYTNVMTETTIKVRVTNPNYSNAIEKEGTVEITPFEMTVAANPASKNFGEADPAWTASVAPTNAGTTKPNDGVEIVYGFSCEHDEAAGTYENAIVPTGEETQGNYKVTYVPADFVINPIERPAELNVTVESYDEIYDAQAHTITVTGITAGDKVEYSYDGGENWSETLKDYTDVTTTPVQIVVRVTNPNYVGTATATGTVTIRPFELTVKANDASKIYGFQDPELTATEVLPEGTVRPDDQEITYRVSRGNQEDAGTYTDSIIVSGDEIQGNYRVSYEPGTFTITTAPRDVNSISVANYRDIYDADAHSISVAGILSNDTVQYRIDGGEWTDTLPTRTNVTAPVTVEVKVTNPNYTGELIKSATIEILPFEMTVTAQNNGKVFGEDDPTLTATERATVPGTTKPDDGYDLVYKVSRIAGEDVGDYPIQVKGSVAQGNYTVHYESANFTITPADRPEDLTVTATPYKDVYDAAAHTITVNGLTDGDKVEYSYDGGENWSETLEEYTNVMAETTIKVRVTNPNYKGEALTQATVEITPFELVVRAIPKSKNFGEADPALEAEIREAVEGTTKPDGQEIVFGLTREVGEDAGTYPIHVTGEETQGNYHITYQDAVLTINQSDRPAELAVTMDSYRGTYDAQSHSLTVSGLTDGDKVEYSYDNGASWESELKSYKNVTDGVVTILARVTNANYTGEVIATGTMEILPFELVVTADDKTKVAETEDPELTAAESVAVDGTTRPDDQEITYNLSRAAGEAVGGYAITPAGDALQGNYSITYVPGTLTITAAPVTPGTNPNTPAPQDNGGTTPGIIQNVVNTIQQVPQAVANGVRDIAASVQEVLNPDEGDVPLANQNLENHKCCILHFLIMLITTILYGYFTHNMKKRQKKLFEVREELDTELAKRGLPTSKEQKES